MRFCVLIALAFLIGSLGGCASATYEFDPAFSPDEQAAIMSGFALWPGANYAVKVVRLDEATGPVTKECPPSESDFIGDTWTDAHPESARATMCLHMDRLAAYSAGHDHAISDDLTQVSAHEYGHVFGLAHSSDADPPSVMRPSMATSVSAPTAWDLKNAAVAEAQH